MKDSKQYEYIFFVYFACLQEFLSLIEPGKSNLIVIHDVPELKKFLREILPNEKIITIREINSTYRKIWNKVFFQRIFDILYLRVHIPKLFKEVSSQTKVFFFSEAGDIAFLLFYRFFKCKKKLQVNNIYSHLSSPPFDWKVPDEDLNKRLRYQLWIIQAFCGLDLAWFELPYKKKVKYIGLDNPIEHNKYDIKTWSEIARKYHFNIVNNTKNAVLFIDLDLNNILGINVKKSQRNFVKFFNSIIDKGFKIHLKGHYGHKNNSLQGTVLENKIELLDTHFPVEMIMNNYEKVYGIASSSLGYRIKGTKYSLVKLLVFESEFRRDQFHDIYSLTSGDEIKRINQILVPNDD